MIEKANVIANALAKEVRNQQTLDRMARLHKGFEEMRKAHYGFVNAGSEGVHLLPDLFLRLFQGYKVTNRESVDYPVELSAKYDGVTFFCILQPEKWQAIRQEGEEEQ